MARWLHRAVAEPVARYAGAITLSLSQDVAGCIALDNGAVTLRRILLPIDQVPHLQAAVDAAIGLAHTLGCPEVACTLVYVGATGNMPTVDEPCHAGWIWDRRVRRGEVGEQILDVSTAGAADLIVLTTQDTWVFSMPSTGVPPNPSCVAPGVLSWPFRPFRREV